MDIINILLALASIVFGAFGWLAPRYTMAVLDLHQGDSEMGISEVRASVGCLFVALGVGSLIIATPAAYLMMGVAYAGASLGRATSLILDNPPRNKALLYLGIEAAMAAWLIAANL
ncbi:DUF4345 domain-containing protein [Octadecabacter sp. SW4]|uniref:DUF4345 family protein n=1 Tax=Octadecabacter sp. SW4 TaxID=2602067 RepID=UPI0011C20996|nr:DUF4345 family protein [Octadecabacter sp. SW4]QEE35451.1 DUF4345 domain-containing protein [Octadecabacter sp. SW4]|tara:strand:- start:594 stop:941 length:348 start_codon:yes stop_codon:yes gene_type:complete